MTLMPIEICARDPAGIEMSAPVRRALKKNRIPEVFIRNRLFSTFVRGSKRFGHSFPTKPGFQLCLRLAAAWNNSDTVLTKCVADAGTGTPPVRMVS